MILRLITKDLRRKKTMNVILFLFILLATLFITSSVSNMIIILEGTDYYFEQANLPEYMVVTLDDGSGDARIKDFLDVNPDSELYRSQEQIDRIKFLHNIEKFDVSEPLCYDYYNRKLRLDGLCMTITPPQRNVIRIVEPIKDGKE